MLPDQVSNPGPLTYESGALLIALRGPASFKGSNLAIFISYSLLSGGSTLNEKNLLLGANSFL